MKNRPETGLFDGVKPIYMIGLVLIGLFFVSFGLLDVLGGKTNYLNPWGHVVFAPFAILIGLLKIVAIIFAWVRNR
jgi:hypothetical protein